MNSCVSKAVRSTCASVLVMTLAWSLLSAPSASAQSCARMTPIGSGADQAFDMAALPDGRFLLAGYSHNGVDEDIALVRYLPDGRLDLGFDSDGILTHDIGASNERARAVAVQADGKIVIAGFTDNLGNDDWFVARYDADGTLDPSFGGGIVTTAVTGFQDRAFSIAIQPDGKIVAAGFAGFGNEDVTVVRYNTDGSLDTSFDGDGIASTDAGATDRINDVKIQPDGKIVVGGNTNLAGDKAFLAVRYNADGSLDTSFDTDGIVTTQISANADNGEALDLYTDGRIALSGFYFDGTDEDFVVVRYNANGSLDTSFDGDGIAITDYTGNDDNIDDLIVQPDGKILASGYTHNGVDQDFGVVRYNLDGTLDASFGVGGRVTAPIGTLNDNSEASALLPDGSFIVAGFSDNGSDNDFSWTRHNPDGSVATGCGIVNYRSIGTAADYTDGTGVTATNGSTVVTGIASATWRSSNRGRGDRITIDGVPYTVVSVDSETQLTLSSPYNETSGSGKTYSIARKFSTLPAWESCIDATSVVLPSCHDVYTADFIADGRSEVGVAYNDSAVPANPDFTLAVFIGGSTTDATHDITLTADDGNRHYGLQTQGVLIDIGGSGSDSIRIEDDFVTVEWIEIRSGGGGSDGVEVQNQSASNQIAVRNMLIHDTGSSGIAISGSTPIVDVFNNFVFQSGSRGIGILGNPTATIRVLNNTVYANPNDGISAPFAGLYPNVLVRNNISHGNGLADYNVPGLNPLSSHNVSGDDPALGHSPGGGGVDDPVLANIGFVDPFTANMEDLHIQPVTSVAWEAGVDLSGFFTGDIDDGSRPSGAQWDIGADEEGAAASLLVLANHPSGQVTNKFSGASPITDTWFQFRLTRSGTLTVDTLRVAFTTIGGVANGDVASGELWEDTNGNGTWDDSGGGDTLLEGSVAPSGGVLTFNNNFSPGASGTNYFVRATVSNVAAGDATVFSLDTAGIDEVQTGARESGSVANALHSQSASPTINYRSIGTNTGILYQAGTASISAGSNVVTFGGGASLPSPTAIGAVGQGDKMVIGSETFFILTRYSATQVAVQQAAASGHAGEAYTITRAYNTIQDWENDCVAVPGCLPTSSGGRGGNLVVDDRHEVGVAYNDAASGAFIDDNADGWVVIIENSTIDATHHRELTVAVGQRHDGTAGTGAVIDGQSSSDFPIRIHESNTRVEWFEMKNGHDPGNNGSTNVLIDGAATNVLLEYLLVYDYGNGTSHAGVRTDIGTGSESVTVRNSIFYNGDYAARCGEAGDLITVENVTSYNMNQRGFQIQSGCSMSITNSIATASGIEDFTAGITGDYNSDADGTSAPGANSLHGVTAASLFVSTTPGSEDLHLKAGANAIDAADPTPLAFCCDIDGATRSGRWDIGADEGGAVSCCDLQVTEGAATITVTGPGSFAMRFNDATGGGIDEYYDLVEDPAKNTDLVGGATSHTTLFVDEIEYTPDGRNYRTGINDQGAQAHLLEVTPTRVRVRQQTFYENISTGNILAGVAGVGDHSIYPSGKLALHWERSTTASVGFDTQQLQHNVHYQGAGTLSNWTGYAESGLLAPSGLGGEDFTLIEIEQMGARTDFLNIMYQDWAAADQTLWGTNGVTEHGQLAWDELTAGTIAADTTETWNFLTYFKSTNFMDNTDPAVTGRVDDYRPRTACATCGPDDLASPAAPTAGGGWFHATENTAGPSDFFNEAEGAYTMLFDMSTGLTFDLDGGLGTPGTPVRHAPFFKIRRWRSLQNPTVTLEGAALSSTDFTASVKPLSRAHAAQDPIWYSTLQSPGAVSTPDIGSLGTPQGTITYPTARYGRGARFDGAGDAIVFGNTAMDVTKGTVEFWVQPEFDHTDGVRHTFWFNAGSGGDFFLLEKTAANNLELGVFNGGSTVVRILAADYSWRDRDWVHIRASWNEAGSPGSQLRLYVNGQELTHTDVGTYNSAGMTLGNNYIGNILAGTSPANAVIDEFVLYDSGFQPATRAYAGLTSAANEFMASASRNFTLDLFPADAAGRTDYFYFGSDSQFQGLNIMLATAGVGTPSLKWQYWDGVNGNWAALDALGSFVDETNSLTTASGTVYWEDDPDDWEPYSVAGGPDLYYVRLHAMPGSNYTTLPTEAVIKTDILLFQYCANITTAAQTFSFAVPQPTAVELVSFDATGADETVELAWVTASEIDNLGFHLYRAVSAAGPYERITSAPIPGLGSSPEGKQYSYTDSELSNGVTYYYQLEDIETTGNTERHGPVWATPQPAESSTERNTPGNDPTSMPEGYEIGRPELNRLRVVSKGADGLVLELITRGFHVHSLEDGSVRLEVPGLEALAEATGPRIPVKRTWVDARAERKVKIVSVQARDVRTFTDMRPTDAEVPELEVSSSGTVRAARRAPRRIFRRDGLLPSSAATIVSVGFQGEDKKALVELAPLRWDEANDQLLLARRLVVRLSFREREPAESASPDGRRGRRYQKRRSHARRLVVARLGTTEKGLHRVRFEDVMRGRRKVRAKSLRLSRQGESVAFHLEPNTNRFERGSVLYFVSDGAHANPYGGEAVYELEVGAPGEMMVRVEAPPAGEAQPVYWNRSEWEENRYYQAALVDAPDQWLWDLVFAPEVKSYPIDVSALASSTTDPAKLTVRLQGASDFAADPDHHVRIYVNGSLVDELSWDGKQAKHRDIELAPGLLVEGANVLEIENVGDTEAAYSMVMLDGYAVEYPRIAQSSDGRLAGRWNRSGTAELSGFAAGTHVVDMSHDPPRWLTDTDAGADGRLRFSADAGGSYLAVSPEAVFNPVVTFPAASHIKRRRNRADYILIAPEQFSSAAAPLVELRRRQGLRVEAVSIEDIYAAFGFGEPTPEALRDFLSYAYHHWRQPSPRYVVLLGDATYDYKDYLGTGVTNQIPPRMVKTSYLWTSSDPSYAAVNGNDILPDLAIGRLPAATLEEARAIVQKIVSYEMGDADLNTAPVVLVADDPDQAGNFEADADALARGVLGERSVETIYLSSLGTHATRDSIIQAFDRGASLVSYLGHGGIHLWADENIFNTSDSASLSPQSQLPLLLTMNCLNGYFHFPYFSSLSEELVLAEGKGAIAAFSPSGLSLNGPAHQYHEAMLAELLGGSHERLGDAVLAAQATYAQSGSFPELLTIYHLLGDPALTLK